MDRMVAAPAEGNDVRGALFPPIVRYATFIAAIRGLATRDAESVFAELPPNDAGQARRALRALSLMALDGNLDQLAVRRLADPATRPEALRALLERYYATQLKAVKRGADRGELADLLRVPSRSSDSSAQKARQFLVNAMREAGLTTSIPRAPARRGQSAPTAAAANTTPRPHADAAASPIDPTAARLQRFADQLLDRHEREMTAGGADEVLEERIERVLTSLERVLGGS